MLTDDVSTGGKIKVALRKESVDRNLPMCIIKLTPLMSLSARRAWIEMMISVNEIPYQCVALRKESVDRNIILPKQLDRTSRRSPQGERG